VNDDLDLDVDKFHAKFLRYFPAVKPSAWMDYTGPGENEKENIDYCRWVIMVELTKNVFDLYLFLCCTWDSFPILR
jgi:hypothetical protein